MTLRRFCYLAGLLVAASLVQPLAGTAQPCATPKVRPEYPGGYNALFKFLSQSVRYPALAKEHGLEGQVFVAFRLDSMGVIHDAAVTTGLGSGCDEEALRVVNTLLPFTPAMKDCHPVSTHMEVPVDFYLKPRKGK
jgi:protein TonB